MIRLGIIGGGAAGMAAAAFACNCDVSLLESNEKLGKKMYITGKGRCNVTNNCALYEFYPNIVRGEKFMISALTRFGPPQLMEFLDLNGVRCKTERGARVFPESDKSSDVIKAFSRAVAKTGAKIYLNTKVKEIKIRDKGFLVISETGEFEFDRLIIATGGLSYPLTGSTGDGLLFGNKFGHSVVKCVPGLSAIETVTDYSQLEGLSLRNVALKGNVDGMKINEFGEMLFTDKGISGPIVLTVSSRINRKNISGERISLDLKPALSPETLDERLQIDLRKYINRDISNILCELLPKALIPFVLVYAGISPSTKANSLTKDQRYAIGFFVKNFPIVLKKIAPIEEAIVTSGGIELKEINPKTMESKIIPGLYFAGEVLDVDCLTGGFNLQCAISTGVAAGRAASMD